MTDELTIQGVNPQMQQVQKKNNTVPYTLGGAVVGAAGGYLINNAVQKNANWEDLVKEVKDTTDFSTKAEPATWNSLKEKANEVAKLQEQLKNLPEKTLPDNAEEVTKLKDAKEKYAKALEAEKKKLDVPVGNRVEIKPAAKMEMNYPSKYANFEEFKNAYEPLQQQYETALSNARATTPYIEANTAYTSAKTNLETIYTNAKTKAGSITTEKEINKAFKLERASKASRTIGRGNIYDDIYENVKTKMLPKQSSLTNEQKKALGEFVAQTKQDKVDEIVKGLAKTQELHSIMDKNGNLAGYVICPKGTADQALKDINENIKSQRKSLAEELTNKAKERFKLGLEIDKYTNNKFKVSDELFKQSGLADFSGLQPKATYEAHAKALKNVINLDRSRLNPAELAIVNSYDPSNTKSVREVCNMINARQTIANQKEKKLAELNKQFLEIVDNDPRISNLKDKVDLVLQRDHGVKKMYGKLKNKFPELFPASSKLSESEIASKAEQALKGQEVANKLKLAQDAFDEAVKTKGTANTAAKEAIEGQIKTATEALEKGAKELAGKLKTGGMNKYAAMAIGGVALALAGFGIASSKKA